jgi:DNA-damage-inducible protein D
MPERPTLRDLESILRRAWRIYRSKGYADPWIRKRFQGIGIREELTDEWRSRGVEKGEDFRRLTEEVSRSAFGLIPSEHREFKGLSERESLRDHMTETELVFAMLAEAAAAEIARSRNVRGVDANRRAARAGGTVAGKARKALEKQTGRPVVSRQNFIRERKRKKV